MKCLLPVVVWKKMFAHKMWKLECLIGPCGKNLFKKANYNCFFESKLNLLLQKLSPA